MSTMKVLVCNVGSTSLKFKLYDMPECKVLAKCGIERVGSVEDSKFTYIEYMKGNSQSLEKVDIPSYECGIKLFLQYLTDDKYGVIDSISEIERAGFKTTLSKGHYGIHELDEEVLKGMEDWIELAPVHNRAYLDAIDVLRKYLPDTLFIGAFETAFHLSIPLERRIFGVPYDWYENYGVQRLGYHGASHSYIADVLNEKASEYKAISCHLGGSCSICAIENGRSVDTSFGMSLESGLIHANRVGDIDSSIPDFLRKQGVGDAEINEGLQKNGGLKGISGVSGDLRYVMEAAECGNERAKLAIDVFVNGIIHYIGAFYLDLGGFHYLVFTAGIGEHSSKLRKLVVDKLHPLGVFLDEDRNASGLDGEISTSESSVKVLVIPTDEELGIARRTYSYS